MPEGDTVHRAARRVGEAFAGQPLTRIEVRRDLGGRRPPAPGTVLLDATARGKYLVLRFADGRALHTHLGLPGAWHVYRPGERWRRPGHSARVVLATADGTQAVCFAAPLVEVVERDDPRLDRLRSPRRIAALGPDLCEPDPDLGEVVARAARTPPDRPVGDVLLDQRVAAGIGNVYRSEVCWAERVHPQVPVGTLGPDVIDRLYATAHRMLRANLDRPRRVTHGRGLAVYGRARRGCPRCGTAIRVAHAGDDARVTFWCPRCQPHPRPASAPETGR